jgi:diadenosine tetraphosphate (Ap4A) HIT family hydrolase
VNSELSGYFMVGSKMNTNDLSRLPKGALSELGSHLAKLQQIMEELLSPTHFYVGRYGHMTGHAIHFHVIPVYDWVARAFDSDERYKALRQFYTPGVYEDGSDSTFDGAEMTLFIWREFCESKNPPEIQGPSVHEIVEIVRKRIQDAPCNPYQPLCRKRINP